MANKLSPIPKEDIKETFLWREWFQSLFNTLSPGYSGTVVAGAKTFTIVNGIITNVV